MGCTVTWVRFGVVCVGGVTGRGCRVDRKLDLVCEVSGGPWRGVGVRKMSG